jgi:hypothetical protein
MPGILLASWIIMKLLRFAAVFQETHTRVCVFHAFLPAG